MMIGKLTLENHYYMIRILVLSLFFIHLSDFLFAQTCIISIRTKTVIYVAADIRELILISSGIDKYGQTVYDTVPNSLCKIQKLNANLIFANSGISLDALNNLALQCSKKYKKMKTVANKFAEKCIPILNDFLKTGKSKGKEAYESRVDHIKQGLEFLFCGFEDNIPKRYCFLIIPDSPISQPVKFGPPLFKNADMPITKDSMMNYWPIGEKAAIYPYPTKKLQIPNFIESNMIQTLNGLIKIQHDLTPYDVSDSCDIIKIDKNGIHWLQKTGVCN
jgi:hypothetical protein